MVRMTDLLKKAKKKIGAKKEAPSVEKKQVAVPKKEPLAFREKPIKPRVPEKEEVVKKEEPPAGEPVEFSGLLGRQKEPPSEKEDVAHRFMKASIPDEKETKELYFETVKFVEVIFNTYKAGSAIIREDIINISHKIVNNIVSGARELLKLFHKLDSLELHRYYNAVNVSILSVAIGIYYKHNKSILLDLAIIGLVHDIDLIKIKDIIEKPERLHGEELEKIRKHSLNTATFVDRSLNFKDEMVKGILQHHERKMGQGYPAGLTDRDIHDLAVIVSIADTYEAMTHSRHYKEKIAPPEAILNIINNGKELFPNKAVKALVSCIGLYPVGSWIELNTGEIGKVLMTNPDLPLRPVIGILMDKDRNKFEEMRTIDLQKMPSLYIKQIIEKINS